MSLRPTSLALPRAPGSTLFPYTTLFRSEELVLVVRVPRERLRLHADAGVPLFELAQEARHGIGGPDRKSTRLNSSHGYIPYAVFCLKKKTALLFDFNGIQHQGCRSIVIG